MSGNNPVDTWGHWIEQVVTPAVTYPILPNIFVEVGAE